MVVLVIEKRCILPFKAVGPAIQELGYMAETVETLVG